MDPFDPLHDPGPLLERLSTSELGDPSLPIGVYDSGLGGLTVVRALAARLPSESLLYFGDTARLPYGSKSPRAIRRFAAEAAHFLLTERVKALVVACNTATAHALQMLRAHSPVPVVGVIAAGARAAHDATVTGRIGVIGTYGTIASGAYDRAVRNLRPHVEMFAQPCPLFVPLAEEGLAGHPAAELVAREYLAPLAEVGIDTLVLGCTHYPLLKPLIERVLGPEVRLIDSGEEAAREMEATLAERGLLAPAAASPTRRFTVSDMPLRFRTLGRSFLGGLIEAVEEVEVEGRLEAAASARRPESSRSGALPRGACGSPAGRGAPRRGIR